MPAGQVVGGIQALEPAGELVTRFVAEAELALSTASAAVGRCPRSTNSD
jgi:hypothetical protein